MNREQERAAFDKLTRNALQTVIQNLDNSEVTGTSEKEIARTISSTSVQIGRPVLPAELDIKTIKLMVEDDHYIFPKKYKGVKDFVLVKFWSFTGDQERIQQHHFALVWNDKKARRIGYRYLTIATTSNGSPKLLMLAPEYVPIPKKQNLYCNKAKGDYHYAKMIFVDYLFTDVESLMCAGDFERVTLENSSMDY